MTADNQGAIQKLIGRIMPDGAGATTDSQWSIKGEYAEACNCDAACQCWWGEPPDDDQCTAAVFWHIDEGEYEGVSLDGLSVGVLVWDHGVLLEGGWDVVVLMDEQATEEQAGALEDIFMGRAGGVMGAVAGLIAEVKDIAAVPITYSRENGHRSITAGDAVSLEADTLTGLNDEPGTVSPSAFAAPSMEATAGKSSTATVSFNDDFSWDVSGNNAYFGAFEYGPA